MKNIVAILSVVIILVSCGKEDLWMEGDFFFIRHKGADMPVWVRGNTQSNVFILHLHGGPGGSSIDEGVEKVYLPLESDYAMVYWDQRGSGASQGKAKKETITMEQFVGDLELVVDLINSKYNNPKIFLHGHSWGGALGAAFLSTENNQNKIKGWIVLDGAQNWKLGMELSVEWVKNKANESIANNNEITYWTDAIDLYNQNPIINSIELMNKHAEYVGKSNGYTFDSNNPNLKRFSGWQLYCPSGDLNNGSFVKKELIVELTKSYSDGLNNVRIPTLIMWGRHDGILPVELAQEAYEAMGTDSLQKRVFIFENSAHSPNREEPDLFIAEFKMFIEEYK